MERTAFARAKAYLDFSARAKWAAMIAGAGAAVFYVILVVLFALLIDLLVSRGRVPNLAQLSVPEQEQFIETWKALPTEVRQQAIQQVGFGEFDGASKPPAASAKLEDKQRYAAWLALTGAEHFPPLPSKMNADDLKKWAQERGPLEEPPYVVAMKEQELRWRAYVWNYLKEHVGVEAANSYQPKVNPGEPLMVPGLGEENRQPHGVLSLVVRLRGAVAGRMLNAIAAIDPWMWEGGGKDPNRSYLMGLLLLAIVATVLAAICMIMMNLRAAQATVEAVLRLRRAVYHHAMRAGEASPLLNGAPEIPNLFTRHIEAVHEALNLWLTTVSRYPAQIVLLLALALAVQPWLALAVVLFALLVWLLGGHLVAAFRRQGRSSARLAASRLVLMLESIKLTRLVKSYLMELFNQSRVERQLADYSRAHLRRYRGEAFARPVLFLLVALAGISLLYLSARIVLSDGLSLAGLTILVVAVAGVYPPVKGWFDMQGRLRRGRDASVALFEFLDRKEAQAPIADAEFLQPLTKALEFRQVSVKQPGDRVLLEDVNLAVKAGETIGIMGGNAEEKQAFLQLIPRFVEPADGELRIDGRNLRWVTLESLRAQLGVISQTQLIFNDTVTNNIGCGDPGISLPRIIEAAKIAHAHQFVQKLPYGYETAVGEVGHALRVGEQFRIALARAIVRDPAIYIIEEPPLAALDDDTKALLDDTFNRVLPGKTVFFLPHRISTLKRCDRIVLLHNGTIEAVAEHRELVQGSSLYKHLYYLEFNQFAESA